jgi:hypothetical protein
MDRVEEIESAIRALPPHEYLRLVQWFREREQARWDERMDRDAASGKLDFLSKEAAWELARRATRRPAPFGPSS